MYLYLNMLWRKPDAYCNVLQQTGQVTNCILSAPDIISSSWIVFRDDNACMPAYLQIKCCVDYEVCNLKCVYSKQNN